VGPQERPAGGSGWTTGGTRLEGCYFCIARTWISSCVSFMRGGTPSITHPTPPPCDSPKVVTRNMEPNELAPDARAAPYNHTPTAPTPVSASVSVSVGVIRDADKRLVAAGVFQWLCSLDASLSTRCDRRLGLSTRLQRRGNTVNCAAGWCALEELRRRRCTHLADGAIYHACAGPRHARGAERAPLVEELRATCRRQMRISL